MIFRNFVLENFPFLEDDFDALTDYELFCKMVEYMKKSLEHIESYDSQFVDFNNRLSEMENYFNNLDVQEEIDNKLDEMVEDGTLQEIISDYLNSKAIFGFDNVASMKISTNLINGSYAETLGFYNKGDGGNSLYKIRTINNDDVVDECTIISLNDENLIAELINRKDLSVKQFGAKGDGTTNDTTALSRAINYIETNEILELFFPVGFYKITDTLQVSKAIKLKGAISTLYNTNTDVKSVSLYWDGADNKNMLEIKSNVAVYGLNVENIGFNGGDKQVIGIDLTRAKFSRIINCAFTNIKGCIYLSGNSYHNLIEKCFFRLFTNYGIYIDYVSTPSNANIIKENTITLPSGATAIHINQANAIIIKDNMIEGNGSNLIPIYIIGTSNASGIVIEGNRIETLVNLDNEEVPNFLITILQSATNYVPVNNYINSNALFPQIIKNNATIINNYYLINDESYGLNYNNSEIYNLIKNPTLKLNDSSVPYYWKTNSANITFALNENGINTDISISNETVKYPAIYQFIDIKKYRGKRICLSYKIKCQNATTEPVININFYKGGTQKINDAGTYLGSGRDYKRVYDNNYLIGNANLNVPTDADDLFININFNGTGANTPADNVMTVEYINISDIFVNKSNFIGSENNIIDTLPSDNRPTGYNGMIIFDTTLSKLITYYNGSWYDSTGTSV